MNDKALKVEWIPAKIKDKEGHRLMVILAAPGCSYAFGPAGGCTNCSFPSAFGLRHKVTTEEYEAQMHDALEKIPEDNDSPVEVDLYVSGSFLNPAEVPPDAQKSLVAMASRVPSVKMLTVETRPEFVSRMIIEGLVESMSSPARQEPPGLEFAIGLETADDTIRLQNINKGFTWAEFERSAQVLSGHDVSLMVYLLLKPLGTEERQAIEDIVQSAEKVFSMAHDLGLSTRIALEPCFVGPGTVLEQEFEQGRYQPPWLWSVVEATSRISKMGPVIVGLSDEGLNPKRSAYNCELCSLQVRQALEKFNATQDPALLHGLSCQCRTKWEKVTKTT